MSKSEELLDYLCEQDERFAKDIADGNDIISAFDGYFVNWDEVISACGGGCYGNSPIELITDIINERDDLLAGQSVSAARIAELESDCKAMAEAIIGAEPRITGELYPDHPEVKSIEAACIIAAKYKEK